MIEKAIADGVIHQEMSRRDAVDLVQKHKRRGLTAEKIAYVGDILDADRGEYHRGRGHVTASRVLTESIGMMSNLTVINEITAENIDPQRAAEWLADLDDGMTILRRLRRMLVAVARQRDEDGRATAVADESTTTTAGESQ